MLLARLKRFLIQPAILSSTIVTAALLGAQQAGVLQPIELKAFDQLMQRRSSTGPDSRLLIVAVTEKDLQTWNWPLPSRVLDNVLGKLGRHQPRVIGLDIFRDLPVEPGHAQLLQRLQQDDRIVPICKHGDGANPETPPPAGVPIDRVGFSDLVEDTDGIIRRS
ncbi:CHASE2 domain-containing protein, partial [Leptolyngbya sp. FACHB-36]|uniref:CHASE2 domain-containing protein n=1 Tax=Leptolyngbya sp. FACHB-36 TaxID=2692808 RepID=UPI001681B334